MLQTANKIKPSTYYILILSIADIIYCNIYKTRSIKLTVAILSSIIIVHIFNKYLKVNKGQIISSRNGLYSFLICYIILFSFIIIVKHSKNLQVAKIIVIQAILLASLLSCYLFKFRLGFLNWSIDFKTLAKILVIYLVYLLAGKSNNFNDIKINSLLDIVWVTIYPSLYEEIIYRGFLTSGLINIRIDESKVNIIQSFVFGLTHFTMYMQNDSLSIIGVSHQMLYGYLIGAVYLYFRSITPCVILHTLIDSIRL